MLVMVDLRDIFPFRALDLSAVAALGGGGPILLAFRAQPQGSHAQWCWAAITSSVSGYPDPPHNAPIAMCQIAANELGKPCCGQPTVDGCDVPNSLDGPLSHIGRLRQPIINGYLSSAAVTNELSANLPLPIRVQWAGGAGHFAAIYGVRVLTTGVQYAVTDPIYGEHSVDAGALVQGGYLSSGTWTHSYLVKP